MIPSDFFLRTPADWAYWQNHMRRIADVKILIDFSSYGTSMLQRSLKIRYTSRKAMKHENLSNKSEMTEEDINIFMKSQFPDQCLSPTTDQDVYKMINELSELSVVKRLPSVVS